jgi:hypothetical protein
MNTLATALALALVIVPALSQSAAAAARKHDRDTCQSQQNDLLLPGLSALAAVQQLTAELTWLRRRRA